MVKFKCWKKKGEGFWENKKDNKALLVQTFSSSDDVVIQKFDHTKSVSEGGIKQIGKDSFRDVSSATKFAKAYMRKHDRC